ncbi:hypothetical protein [Bailinhaonella thermotolerans]|uniref:Uncharacterized protein n=1 Tax=Bailinhaonella thermotolerans TaxID=1070861 RepID=A0A3A4BC50_9ACTN|nr:hypothetical protein [Bailinhaonella thermotolerans]RJL31758.1 hypothetical protein D5H75_18870 [Bailinhaonella thermotolerans]
MSQAPGAQPALKRTPLDSDERARAAANFVPLVTERLTADGSFRVSADTPELIDLFQDVARRAGEVLGRPVTSYANGRYMIITFVSDQGRAQLQG